MDYTDIDTLHAYGIFTHPTEEGDALLETFISAASAVIDNICHRVFGIADGAAPVACTFTKDNGLLWESRRFPRTLWLEDDLCSTPTFAEVPAPTVTLVPMRPPYYRIVRAEAEWPDPTVVTGHWAYSMTPPAPITQACLRLALWMYHQRESTDGDRPMVTSGGIFMLPNALPRDIQFLLMPYKKVRAG
ncbi:MAG: hypothetical protein NTU91_01120 [Chloroflexi bacterium]|nr:hypothetical protein [Chloroflexota bacterium]